MYSVSIVALGAALLGGRLGGVDLVSYPDTACPHRNVPLEGRKSPLDSVTFTVAQKEVKVCYGRPSSRGRVMLGGTDIPYGKIWRTGANEPTIIFAPVPLKVAGLSVAPGVYSLYTVPRPGEWEVIVNRSTSQWGRENNYTAEVKAQEVGRAKVKTETVSSPVETFTIRAEPSDNKGAALVLEWEKTRIRIPVQAAG
jgi:Protein of unknown function (DUF2911)